MDFGKAFTFVTEDENWVTKILIGSAIILATTFLIFPYVLLIGYQLGIMRNVMAGQQRPLPEWNDIGTLFTNGFMVWIALLIYTSPVWLLFCVAMGATFLPILAAGNEDLVGALFGMTFLAWFVLGCLALIFGFFIFFITPAIYIQYIRTESLGATFRLGEVFAIARQNASDILLTAVVSIVAYFALSMLLNVLVATICGIILAIPLYFVGYTWIVIALGHLYGQIAARTEGKAAQ